jgi:hypothetical protein
MRKVEKSRTMEYADSYERCLERLMFWKNKLEEIKKSNMCAYWHANYFRTVQFLYDNNCRKFLGLV